MAIERAALAEYVLQEGFSLGENALEALAGYLDLLLHWNKAMNLVGTRTWQETVSRLLVDSFYLGRFLNELPLPPEPLCWDPGAGAGLPGIPLRMVWQRGSYWMIEAREKRALFLSTVLARHPLPQTHVFRGRVEAFFEQQAAQADVLVSRAFMPWQKLLPLIEPRLAPGGIVVLLLNADAEVTPERLQATCPGWAYHSSCAYSASSDARVMHAVCRVCA